MEGLDAKKQAMVREYKMILNEKDDSASIRMLSDCGWNLETAVNTSIEVKSGGGGSSSSARRLGSTLRSSDGPSGSASSNIDGPAGPSSAAAGGSTTMASSIAATSGTRPAAERSGGSWVPQNTILAAGLSFIGSVAHRVLPEWVAETQDLAPQIFTARLKRDNPGLPDFFEGSYKDACRQARQQNRSLFVYIHSQGHEDTKAFIRDTLTQQLVRECINSNFVSWAGSVTQADTYRLCNRLRIEGYPCVAVLNPQREATRVPAPLHEGLFPPAQMVDWLLQVKTKYQTQLADVRRRNQEVKTSSQLREMQDLEYERALEADRQREEAERRAKEDAAMEQQREREREAQEERKRKREAEAEEELKKRKIEQRKALAEPPAGPGVVLIMVRLPDGKQMRRRFRENDSFKSVYDYIRTFDLKTQHGEPIGNKWSLVSRYPRRKFDNLGTSIKDAGLGKQAVLFVQEDVS